MAYNGVYLPDGTVAWRRAELVANGGRIRETNELSLVPGIEIEPLSVGLFIANYRWNLMLMVFLIMKQKFTALCRWNQVCFAS
jgi:hypothetical protein